MRWMLLIGVLSSVACGDDEVTEADLFLEEVLGIMRTNVVTRDQIDWDELESEVFDIAEDAVSVRQAYPALSRALVLIRTNHSFLLSEDGEVITYPSDLSCVQDYTVGQETSDTIGYIQVTGFSSSSRAEAAVFATQLQSEIAAQDNPDVNDWVVDLRNNTGGNMWPMIAGLGPLFDNELLGHFIDADGVATPWGYVRGSAVIDGTSRVSVNTPYVLENRPRRIAVLSSRRVASSGEATLIAFKKQSNVRIFGSDSCGLSTANTAFPLSNGTTLFLTTAITADREQEAYGGTVRVDEMTDPGSTLAEAFRWLEANP